MKQVIQDVAAALRKEAREWYQKHCAADLVHTPPEESVYYQRAIELEQLAASLELHYEKVALAFKALEEAIREKEKTR
jgi:hypothetical protein